MTNAQPVLLITRDGALCETIRGLLPDADLTITGDARNAGHYWHTAPAVLIGADVLAEIAAAMPDTDVRAGVYVVTTPDGPHAYIPGAATVPAECVVELAQPDAPAWLAARLRYLAAGGDPGTPPNGCEACGAAPGKRCVVANCQGSWH